MGSNLQQVQQVRPVQPEEGQSANNVLENIARLNELFPEAFSEGGVNFDVLRQLLGDAKVLDEGEEKYGLNWHGKKKARQMALIPSTGTLLPCPEKSVDWDTTQNLFIEGENLEVLKLLQKSYANKIKMIYIDPPYNTGNEFIYSDIYQENLDTYLKYTGQVDSEGMRLSSNMESSGRKHTNWLSMMYPRLKVSRNLLCNDGLVLISIDDNEVNNLCQICNEIFGPECFVAKFLWKSRQTPDSRKSTKVSTDHEYIVCYAKNIDSAKLKGKLIDVGKYKNPDNDPRGPWASENLTVQATKNQRPNQFYDIIDPDSGRVFPANPKRVWARSKSVVDKMISEGRVLFPKGNNGRPREKKFLNELESSRTGFSTWLDSKVVGYTTNGTRDFSTLFDERIFDFPKPISLLKTLIDQCSNTDSIVLDYFAGSASLAQAVYESNLEDGGTRRYILVQFPEVLGYKTEAAILGYNTICDISVERIRRSINSIKESNESYSGDLGFKYFSLSSSSIRAWSPDGTDIEESLLSSQEHLIDGRSEQDILYELFLKRGVDLAVPIESRIVDGKTVQNIGYGILFACLDESITRDHVESIGQGIVEWYRELAPYSGTHVFFRDSAFNDDVSKTNMAAILEQNGINHVRSL